MKTCPNCNGERTRNWAGDGPGSRQCRMCRKRGFILEPSDVPWLARGWHGGTGDWYTRGDPPHDNELRNAGFDVSALMVLIAGADSVPGQLSKAALKERGMARAWRGVIVHPPDRARHSGGAGT